MSYGLTAYLVPESKVLAIPGSKDRKLLAQLLKAYGEQMESDDEEYECEIPEAEVLKEIIQGKISRPDLGHLYAFTFEYCIKWHGLFLSNENFYPVSMEQLQKIDKLVKLPVSMYALASGKLPVNLPEPEDFPGTGYWSESQIKKAAPRLRKLLYEDCPPSLKQAFKKDDRLAMQLRDLNRWLWQALGEPGSIIVGYYS